MTVDIVECSSHQPTSIALALFASYQLYWFWGLVIAQIIIVTMMSLFHTHCVEESEQGILFELVISICMGIGLILIC